MLQLFSRGQREKQGGASPARVTPGFGGPGRAHWSQRIASLDSSDRLGASFEGRGRGGAGKGRGGTRKETAAPARGPTPSPAWSWAAGTATAAAGPSAGPQRGAVPRRSGRVVQPQGHAHKAAARRAPQGGPAARSVRTLVTDRLRDFAVGVRKEADRPEKALVADGGLSIRALAPWEGFCVIGRRACGSGGPASADLGVAQVFQSRFPAPPGLRPRCRNPRSLDRRARQVKPF